MIPRYQKSGALALVLLVTLWPVTPTPASIIGDRVWNDLNRNGIQDEGEPGLSNISVRLFSSTSNLVNTTSTDADGHYTFLNPSNGVYFVQVVPEQGTRFTIAKAGGDDNTDSDITSHYLSTTPFDYTGIAITNLDAGIYLFTAGFSFSTRIGNTPSDTPHYVTNGSVIDYRYTIKNTGETPVNMQIYNFFDPEADYLVSFDCTQSPYPGNTLEYTSQMVVTQSMTNVVEVIGFANDLLQYGSQDILCCGCNEISYLPFLYTNDVSIIIVVTNNPLDFDDHDNLPNWWEMQYGLDPLNSNAPDSNADDDWMTDMEEYFADTDPSDPASYLANVTLTGNLLALTESSTGRVYSAWWSTNLLDDPQDWILVPPEQTGSGAIVTFSITNDAPEFFYRAGVRLP